MSATKLMEKAGSVNASYENNTNSKTGGNPQWKQRTGYFSDKDWSANRDTVKTHKGAYKREATDHPKSIILYDSEGKKMAVPKKDKYTMVDILNDTFMTLNSSQISDTKDSKDFYIILDSSYTSEDITDVNDFDRC